MPFPTPMYVLLRNQQYLTVENAETETFDDKLVYDGETYRNELPAGYIGRLYANSVAIPFVSPGSPESLDDRVTATAPFPLEKTRTMIVWADLDGDTVGECWADQFIGISSAIPKFVS